jgi:hypothetical protein
MERAGQIRVWTDRELLAGDHWEPALKAQLHQADLILLLISTDYFQSDYIHEVEIKEALERHQQGDAKVIPVIVRPCDWESDDVISSLQILPTDGIPVNDTRHWQTRDAAWVDVVRGLRKTIQQLRDDRAEVARKKQAAEAQRQTAQQAALLAQQVAEQKQREATEKAAAEAERQYQKEQQRQQAEAIRAAERQRKAATTASEPLIPNFPLHPGIAVVAVLLLMLGVYAVFFRNGAEKPRQEPSPKQEQPKETSPKPSESEDQKPQGNKAEWLKHLSDAAFLLNKGRTELAKKHLESALQLAPQNSKIKDALFLLEKGKVKEAEKAVRAAIDEIEGTTTM